MAIALYGSSIEKNFIETVKHLNKIISSGSNSSYYKCAEFTCVL